VKAPGPGEQYDLHNMRLAVGYAAGPGKWFPRLSPDQNYIAALANTDHILLFEIKTQKWLELIQMAAHYPAWSRDANMCTSRLKPKVIRRSIARRSKITS